MSRHNNGASLTDLKKLRNATGRYKNTAQQQREVATVNNGGGRVAAAEGWVVLGRGGVANNNNHLQEQHLLVQFNKKRAEMAAIENELMEIEMSQRRRMQQQLAMRGQMMYRGIGTPQWVGNNGNRASAASGVSGRRTRVSVRCWRS